MLTKTEFMPAVILCKALLVYFITHFCFDGTWVMGFDNAIATRSCLLMPRGRHNNSPFSNAGLNGRSCRGAKLLQRFRVTSNLEVCAQRDQDGKRRSPPPTNNPDTPKTGTIKGRVVCSRTDGDHGLENVFVQLVFPTKQDYRSTLESNRCYKAITIKNGLFNPKLTWIQDIGILTIINADSNVYTLNSLSSTWLRHSIAPKDALILESLPTSAVPWTLLISESAPARAFVLVTKHPFVSITDAAGGFEIDNIPHGTWKLRFWHEATGNVKDVAINGNSSDLNNGNINIEVNSDAHDLGVFGVVLKDCPAVK